MHYLIRRGATYYIQVRLRHSARFMLKTDIFKQSLKTKDRERAKIRLRNVLSWIADMDIEKAGTKSEYEIYQNSWRNNARRLDLYLTDEWPVDADRIFMRETFETLINDYKRKMHTVHGYYPGEFVVGFNDLFRRFITQTIEFKDALYASKAREELQEKLRAEYEKKDHDFELEKIAFARQEFERGREEERKAITHYSQILRQTPAPPISPTIPNSNFDNSEVRPTQIETTGASLQAVSAPPLADDTALEATIAELIQQYYAYCEIKDGDTKRKAESKSLLEYLAHQIGDQRPSELKSGVFQQFFLSLADVPNRTGIPARHNKTMADRVSYLNAQITEHQMRHDENYDCWSEFSRCAAKTIESNHRPKLRDFLKYMVNEGYLSAMPTLELNKAIKKKLHVPLPRDSFNEDELFEFLSNSMFTGAKSTTKLWEPGRHLVQGGLYWCYLILLTTGMRTGEPVTLEIEDIKEISGKHYFDLRAFDPSKGAVAQDQMRVGKTINASRMIPVHPDLIKLGLIDHQNELREMGSTYLFPDIGIYIRSDGLERNSQEISKDFSKAKQALNWTRKDLQCYSTRHTFDEQLANSDLDSEIRKRLMGQESQHVNGVYGSKGELLEHVWNKFVNARSKALRQGFDLVINAKSATHTGDKVLVKPHLDRKNWKRS